MERRTFFKIALGAAAALAIPIKPTTRQVTSINLTHPGSGYTVPPRVTVLPLSVFYIDNRVHFY